MFNIAERCFMKHKSDRGRRQEGGAAFLTMNRERRMPGMRAGGWLYGALAATRDQCDTERGGRLMPYPERCSHPRKGRHDPVGTARSADPRGARLGDAAPGRDRD